MARDTAFRLPVAVIGSADVARIKRDLEKFDDELHQATLRAKAGVQVVAVQPGQGLAALASLNEYDIQASKDRQSLLAALDDVLKTAPTVTMSFAVDPSSAFMGKLVEWLRTNTDPYLLVRIGLQPNIAAGCTIRTPSKLYDFSLRSKFAQQRPMLVQKLREAARPKVEIKAPTKVPSEVSVDANVHAPVAGASS